MACIPYPQGITNYSNLSTLGPLMKLRALFLLFFSSFSFFSIANNSVSLDYYLANNQQYIQQIPTPESVLGYQVGEWHVRPEQLTQYFYALEKASDRVKVKVIGYSHEKRPLILAFISSPENIKQLDNLQQKHLQNASDTPMISWMGYSVHGNEASGSNASMLFAYHYAASNDKETLAQLNDQVIIVDPSLNPDGLARFASWVNSHKSKTPSNDSAHREHNEGWPSGRTNHYWFDLNRDWLLLRHPESRARVAQFHQWKPHVLTDFHEMGTNATYFFQPGVPSRQNPLTPDANFRMTATIAEYHAKALDDIGSLYYSQENFDDFYYGKGSTYPDVHGTVGILFEQASARGHLQESNFGNVSFPFAIKNHLTTSFSTIKAVQANQVSLKKMRSSFIGDGKKLAKDDKNKAVVFSSKDKTRVNELLSLLNQHHIKVYQLPETIKASQQRFVKNESFVVPLAQPQYRLIKSMFEHRKSFADQVFYDVSAWNMADAFDVNFSFVNRSTFESDWINDKNLALANVEQQTIKNITDQTIALAFDWTDFNGAKTLVKLQQKGLRVQVLTKPASYQSGDTKAQLTAGSLILPLDNQSIKRNELINWLKTQALSQSVEISRGLSISGVDLGSSSVPVLKQVKPMIVVGRGVSAYSAGEAWYWLDQTLNQPVSLIEKDSLNRINFNDYTHLIMVNGSYGFSDKLKQKIEQWVRGGGVIIAYRGGAKWLIDQGWTSSKVVDFDKPVDTKAAYASKGQVDAKHVVGGAITNAVIDTTHPLGFGLDNKNIALFKRGDMFFSEAKESFVSIARFSDKPHRAGYMSNEVAEHIADGTSLLVQGLGRGKLIAFSDNPLFRGYWYGSGKVFNNALFFGEVIRASSKTQEKKQKPKQKKAKKDDE